MAHGASDVAAVIDSLQIARTAFVGSSDGACTSLILAHKHPACLAARPSDLRAFVDAVTLMMNTEPNYTAADLAEIRAPIIIAQSEHDEFIRREHAEYLAHTIPGAEPVILSSASHFAPLQRPSLVNGAVLDFLSGPPTI